MFTGKPSAFWKRITSFRLPDGRRETLVTCNQSSSRLWSGPSARNRATEPFSAAEFTSPVDVEDPDEPPPPQPVKKSAIQITAIVHTRSSLKGFRFISPSSLTASTPCPDRGCHDDRITELKPGACTHGLREFSWIFYPLPIRYPTNARFTSIPKIPRISNVHLLTFWDLELPHFIPGALYRTFFRGTCFPG